MALLARLNAEQKVTILIITHDPRVARQCARQVRIHEGRLIETAAGAPGASGVAHPPPPLPGTGEDRHAPPAHQASRLDPVAGLQGE